MKFLNFIKLGFLLSIICVISGLALSVTYSITKEKIKVQKQREALDSLPLVIPQAQKFSASKQINSISYYEAYGKNNNLIGYALNGEHQGYQSIIKFMVGIDPKGKILGLRILEHGETPGLGARITEIKSEQTIGSFISGLFDNDIKPETKSTPEPWFCAMFRGKFYNTLTVSKTKQTDTAVMAITGATITSEAVVEGIKKTVTEFLREINK
ncbi:RnfABCDGE type electron transport complex subunit G [bacterium]|nr:RnfABCDGE type electron transport complex subunit G [bacterium]